MPAQFKRQVELVIGAQFPELECAICLDTIDEKHPGVVHVTCVTRDTGTTTSADLEHMFCEGCDRRFRDRDPYRRTIQYRFVYPFAGDREARLFVTKSNRFVLSEYDEVATARFDDRMRDAVLDCYRDVPFTFRLSLPP